MTRHSIQYSVRLSTVPEKPYSASASIINITLTWKELLVTVTYITQKKNVRSILVIVEMTMQ